MIETEALLKLISRPALKASVPLFKKIGDKVSYYWNDGFFRLFFKFFRKI